MGYGWVTTSSAIFQWRSVWLIGVPIENDRTAKYHKQTGSFLNWRRSQW